MKVVILCGGKGTRIRDVSEVVPKPMIPIGDRPILWHIMKIYEHYGFREFVLCLGYKGDIIKNFFLNYYATCNDVTVDLARPNAVVYHGSNGAEDWKVTLANTGLETMTGARIARIAPFVAEDESFMLTYGDGVADVNIRELVKFHSGHDKLATVTGVRPAGRFGELELEDDVRVRSFAEKPQAGAGRINGGFFVIRRPFIDRYLSVDDKQQLEREPMMQCASDEELIAFKHDGFWQPMDTVREFEVLNRLWESGQAPWKVWP